MKNVQIFSLPKISDPRGNLTFIESMQHVPFEIKRVFYIYDLPTAVSRGAHAHYKCEQFIICLSGGLEVHTDNGVGTQEIIHLNRPWNGLYIPPYTWASEENFDPGTVYLVLASAIYDASDYIREYSEFLRIARERSLS